MCAPWSLSLPQTQLLEPRETKAVQRETKAGVRLKPLQKYSIVPQLNFVCSWLFCLLVYSSLHSFSLHLSNRKAHRPSDRSKPALWNLWPLLSPQPEEDPLLGHRFCTQAPVRHLNQDWPHLLVHQPDHQRELFMSQLSCYWRGQYFEAVRVIIVLKGGNEKPLVTQWKHM